MSVAPRLLHRPPIKACISFQVQGRGPLLDVLTIKNCLTPRRSAESPIRPFVFPLEPQGTHMPHDERYTDPISVEPRPLEALKWRALAHLHRVPRHSHGEGLTKRVDSGMYRCAVRAGVRSRDGLLNANLNVPPPT